MKLLISRELIIGFLVVMVACLAITSFVFFGYEVVPQLQAKIFATITPTATPTQTATATSTATATPIPTATATATPAIVRVYPQMDEGGNMVEVTQWADGHYTSKIVVTAAQVEATRQALRQDWLQRAPTLVPYTYFGFRVTNRYEYTVRLSKDDVLEGYFRDQLDNNINFWILDPKRRAVYNPGLVAGRHEFKIRASEEGIYILVFDNSHSTFTGRTMQLYWRRY